MENLSVQAVLTFLLALLLTGLALPKLVRIAGRVGLVDLPCRRKIHTTPKPLIGGVAILTGVLFSSLVFIPFTNLRGYFLGLAILLIVGFLDDFRELNHRLKFVAQFLAVGTIIFWSGARLETFGEILPGLQVHLGYLAMPITFLAGIGVINALNMADGLDGLAGGLALAAFASFSYLAHLNGQPNLMLLSLAFCGALIVFLRYNWHPASLFMGDAGSLTLGFSLVFLGIVLSQSGRGLVPPVTVLLIMAVPVTDTLTVMTKRMTRQKSPFHADKTHFHHLLLRFGFTKRHSAYTIITISLFLSIIGLAGAVLRIPHYYMMVVFLAYAALYTLFVFRATAILRVKLRITNGKSHFSGGVALGLAKLMEGAERLVKIRWEGYHFSVATPMPCLLIRGNERYAGIIRSISTRGFAATTTERLPVGEVVKAGLCLLDEKKHGKAGKVNLRIPAMVSGIREKVDTIEYDFRFVKKKRSDSRELANFLCLDHNLTGNFRRPFPVRATTSEKHIITG